MAKSAPDQALNARIARLDRNRPEGTPNCGQEATRPRLPWLRAHSIDDQHRAAPFAADADALQHAQHGQDDRAPDADGGIAGHEGDQEGGDAHQQQGGDQRRLAADAVAVVAEDRGADRAADEADEVGAERRQRAGQRILRSGKNSFGKTRPAAVP